MFSLLATLTSEGATRDFSHSSRRLLAVRLILLGDSRFTTFGRRSSSLFGETFGVSTVGLVFVGVKLVTSSAFSGIQWMSSMTPLWIVEPLHRVLLTGTGDSQFAQSVSSMESKPNGVHEKCLLLAGLGFSRGASLRLLIGVGGAVEGVSDDELPRCWPDLDRPRSVETPWLRDPLR